MLGSSRGPQSIEEVVDTLDRMNIGILFMIGGDGTLMAASRIAEAINERNLRISVIGIPKTIDNDIHMVSRSFGFDTAVDIATQAIKGAHNEAESYPYGIGLIMPGHYASERFGMECLADSLIDEFASLEIWASRSEYDPVRAV